jgi:hypothetical protein
VLLRMIDGVLVSGELPAARLFWAVLRRRALADVAPA